MPDHSNRGLGFRPGPVDRRDQPLGAALERLGTERKKGSQFWFNPLRLDQKSEGSCVGFGWTQSVNASPATHQYSDSYARGIYYRARQLDEWQGEDYEGTSVRAGAKSCVEKKWIRSYAFTQDVQEVALWILNHRPVVIGVDWYEGMYEATKQNDYYIKPEGEIVGGHCTEIDGVRWNIADPYFRGLNSWGPDWGSNGRFKLTVSDLEKLLSDENAVACTATEA